LAAALSGSLPYPQWQLENLQGPGALLAFCSRKKRVSANRIAQLSFGELSS
jgi:hypothetical protein